MDSTEYISKYNLQREQQRTLNLEDPRTYFQVLPDIVSDPDRSCQPMELGVSVSGFPGECPLI